MRGWTSFRTVLIVLCLMAVAMPAEARMLYGAAPATMDFDGGGQGLLRGGTETRSLSLQNQGDDPLAFTIAPEGPQASWLDLAKTTTTVAAATSEKVAVTVTVPNDAANGDYEARLRITPQDVEGENAEGGASSTIVQEIVVPVRMKVTDEQVLRMTVDTVQLRDTEEGSALVLALGLTNTGNVAATPEAIIEVYDEGKTGRLATFTMTGEPIAPGRSAEATLTSSGHDLARGPYAAHITATLRDGETAGEADTWRYFDVLEPGALARSGRVTEVGFGTEASAPGDLMPIRVAFENLGEAPVVARMTAIVEKDAAPVAVLDSAPLQVDIGGTVTFEEFWIPEDAGAYTLRGHVDYGGKRAEFGPRTLDVGGEADGDGDRGIPGPGFILVSLAALGAAAVARRRWSA